MTKITKEVVISILRRIKDQKDISAVRIEIDDIADEYNLDIYETLDIDDEPIFDDKDMYLADDEVEDVIKADWDEDDDNY